MVKYVNDNTGRFKERPHYNPKELDRECESIINKLLRERHGEVKFPVLTDDIEVLIEQHASLDMYANLESEYGSDVEGVTEFFPGQKPVVKISKRLSEDERFINRLRTTMTHEFGHVRFHGYLWDMKFENPSLFANLRSENVIVCKRDNIVGASKTDWMEWQAGYVCSAILVPASHVKKLTGQFFEEHNIYGSIGLNDSKTPLLIDLVASTYHVSKDAARVRLSVLNLISENNNQSLFGWQAAK